MARKPLDLPMQVAKRFIKDITHFLDIKAHARKSFAFTT
jgi:hypothetical protein